MTVFFKNDCAWKIAANLIYLILLIFIQKLSQPKSRKPSIKKYSFAYKKLHHHNHWCWKEWERGDTKEIKKLLNARKWGWNFFMTLIAIYGLLNDDDEGEKGKHAVCIKSCWGVKKSTMMGDNEINWKQ